MVETITKQISGKNIIIVRGTSHSGKTTELIKKHLTQDTMVVSTEETRNYWVNRISRLRSDLKPYGISIHLLSPQQGLTHDMFKDSENTILLDGSHWMNKLTPAILEDVIKFIPDNYTTIVVTENISRNKCH